MKNRLIFIHSRLPAALMILLASLQGHSEPIANNEPPVHNGAILGYRQTQIIVGSAARILLKQNTSSVLLNYCGSKFKHLYKSAHSAAQEWQEKHAEIITKAKDINRYVTRTIATHESRFAAEKFNLKIDMNIYDGAQKFKTELANKNRKQQHYLCNRLILSTAMGDEDLTKVIPEHYQRVHEFKLKN